MTLYSDLFTAITAAVGSAGVYTETLPQGAALPAITYQRISMPLEQPMNGHSIAARWSRIQFDCWAATGAAARTLRESLITALLGLTGLFGVSLENAFDTYEPDTQRHRASIDAIFGHGAA